MHGLYSFDFDPMWSSTQMSYSSPLPVVTRPPTPSLHQSLLSQSLFSQSPLSMSQPQLPSSLAYLPQHNSSPAFSFTEEENRNEGQNLPRHAQVEESIEPGTQAAVVETPETSQIEPPAQQEAGAAIPEMNPTTLIDAEAGQQSQDEVVREEANTDSIEWTRGDSTFLADAAAADTSIVVTDPCPQPAPRRRAAPSTPQHAITPRQNAQVPTPILETSLRDALNKLSEKVEGVSASNKQLEDLKNENLELKVELTRLQGELKASNLLLEERSNELAIERSLRMNLEAVPESNNPPKEDPVLVVGSSIIRDLDDNLYMNTKVEAASGATPQTVTQMLENHKKNEEKFSHVIIVAGGNQLDFDSAENQQGITETISDMKVTVAAAQQISDKVSVCQLPPRIHKASAANTINEFNGRLSELPCDIIQTRDQFYLADGTPNDGYLDRDLIHLNLRGSAKLMKSMGLELKDPGNRQVVRNKAAYKNSRSQEPQPPIIASRNGYADAVRSPPEKTPPKSQRKNPPPKSQTYPQTNPAPPPTRESQPQSKTTAPLGNKDNASPIQRPPPLQPEYNFCGYCGEPGHNHLSCRHGGPVQCNQCGLRTHKKKWCTYYHQ